MASFDRFKDFFIHSLLDVFVLDVDFVGQLPEPERPSPQSQLPERLGEA